MSENKNCIPCQGGIPPLNKSEINKFKTQISSEWNVNFDKELIKNYCFDKYLDAIKFTNMVADLAEDQGHHPYIHINYKTVKVILFTHKINGLHENDFLMANKIDKLNIK